MIARLSVAADALEDLTGQHSVPTAKAQHETLARALEAHGLLVFANPDEERELLDAARRIGTNPPGVKARWLSVLAEMKKSKRMLYLTPPGTFGLTGVAAIEELRAGWGGKAQVAVLSTQQASALGVDADGLLVDAPSGLELAAAPIAAYCKTLGDIHELIQRGVVAHGASRDEFWKEVLQPIAVLSRQVVILDQYLFGDVCWHHTKLPHSTRWDPDMVIWALRKLDASMQRGAEVTLMGSTGGRGPRDAADAAEMINDLWNPPAAGRLGKVEIVAGLWKQGQERMPHDRHVRFSAGAAVKSLPGFGRLGRSAVQDLDGMGWQYHWKPMALAELRSAERRVSDGDESTRATVLDRSS